jgi:DNA polymerase (family 10)
MHNREIAAIFAELADFLDVDGANAFRVRAYRDAARVIGGMSESLADLVATGADLTELPNVGEAIAGKIRTIVETGLLLQLEEAGSRIPPALSEIMKLEGMGPKRMRTLSQGLGIATLEDLRRAVEGQRVRGFRASGRRPKRCSRNGLTAGKRRSSVPCSPTPRSLPNP